MFFVLSPIYHWLYGKGIVFVQSTRDALRYGTKKTLPDYVLRCSCVVVPTFLAQEYTYNLLGVLCRHIRWAW